MGSGSLFRWFARGKDTTASRYQQDATTNGWAQPAPQKIVVLAHLTHKVTAHAIRYMNTTNLPALSRRIPEECCPVVKPTG